MNISNTGLTFIKAYESCSLSTYKDVGGVLTIGWGHTGKDVTANMTVTQSRANTLFSQDVHEFVVAVNDMVKVKLTQGQFDALVSLAYNIGSSALRGSQLLKYVNQNKFIEAANEFDKWCHVGGQVVKGLVNRRAAEKKMFLSATPSPASLPRYYTVVGGDNLSSIVSRYREKYGLTMDKVIKLNPAIKNPNLIKVGQRIRIQ